MIIGNVGQRISGLVHVQQYHSFLSSCSLLLSSYLPKSHDFHNIIHEYCKVTSEVCVVCGYNYCTTNNDSAVLCATQDRARKANNRGKIQAAMIIIIIIDLEGE